MVYVSSDPSGSCTDSTALQWNPTSGNLSGCKGGTWTVLSTSSSTGTVTSVSLAGTTNQITATGTCTGTTVITCTLSLPSALVLPGTIDGLTITTTTGTFTISNSKTLTVSNTMTFTATDSASIAFGVGGTVLYTTSSAGSFPTLNQNTTGTASNLSGTPPLPNGTTATTQSLSDNSTDIATDAFAAGQINNVAFCNGFTPTNGQNLQYTTGGTPNPCYSAVTPASPTSALTMLGQGKFTSTSACSTSGTITVTCAAGSIAFSVIPGTYSGLSLRIITRSTQSAIEDDFYIQFNGDTGNNYSAGGYYSGSGGSGITHAEGIAHAYLGPIAGASNASGRASTVYADIFGYATSFVKTFYVSTAGQYGATANTLQLDTLSNVWNSTAAITSMSLAFGSGSNFTTGSVFSLYGVQ